MTESPHLQAIPVKYPEPSPLAPTFHAGDHRFESGWGYLSNPACRGQDWKPVSACPFPSERGSRRLSLAVRAWRPRRGYERDGDRVREIVRFDSRIRAAITQSSGS
jgi:hypothetical protein